MTTSWPHSNACGHRKHVMSSQVIYLGGRQGSVGRKQNLRTCPSLTSTAPLWGSAQRAQAGGWESRAEAQWPSPGDTSTVPSQVCLPLPHRASKPSPPDVGSEVINWQGLWGRAPRACAQPAGGVCSLALLDLQISNKELS